MDTNLTNQNPADLASEVKRPASTVISPGAELSWRRIPAHHKAEIIAALEQASPSGDAGTKIVEVDSQVLHVRNMSSGVRVIYESGKDHNTIVAVLTPREVRLVEA